MVKRLNALHFEENAKPDQHEKLKHTVGQQKFPQVLRATKIWGWTDPAASHIEGIEKTMVIRTGIQSLSYSQLLRAAIGNSDICPVSLSYCLPSLSDLKKIQNANGFISVLSSKDRYDKIIVLLLT